MSSYMVWLCTLRKLCFVFWKLLPRKICQMLFPCLSSANLKENIQLREDRSLQILAIIFANYSMFFSLVREVISWNMIRKPYRTKVLASRVMKRIAATIKSSSPTHPPFWLCLSQWSATFWRGRTVFQMDESRFRTHQKVVLSPVRWKHRRSEFAWCSLYRYVSMAFRVCSKYNLL